MTPVLLQLLLTFGALSLVAIGGANAVLPEMHRQVVERHGWMTDATFAQLYALAQAAPGPNVLSASVMGWHVAGGAGLIAATLGMIVPAAVLAWTVAGWLHRLRHASWLRPAQAGLIPIAIGLLLAGGVTMAQASVGSGGGLAGAIAATSAAFILLSSRSPLWVLLAGAILGSLG